MNQPHNSRQGGIHTRITSFRRILPVSANTISAKMYRSRWYGWEKIGDIAPRTVYGPSNYAQEHRETAAFGCDAGSWYRYRTEGFGTIVVPSGTYSAAAYEQNDSEILCEHP
ncbi:hypothetical protein LX15_006353 [Streptoalloteichus tenebrarius]|uniref:Uncharacterized protein n=1 Tax=Streptoalloteichus tenebrarius (strain ATCC 17920 / DSM 40477 / JCM 4838 / CBS 697.72 / NBRC 16177 / NCIMB 11028 / NRRL B-12390 / A12253. 1 / ISP 5477) TaxID=1933 RepID=A0ABT1I486_STRSD|nr:hypothetical protein [Streptoalloteichus tenebrarius]MCP2262608.1 hypothetical protein [Streptoalloteichus tenebrarius]MCP2262612.1 hypothetical protein [Streptoalloteichus tenebrarius]BFF01938.1 hypothetical protein GCM10020241_36130 [Streptoalloteichus tenebrarius]